MELGHRFHSLCSQLQTLWAPSCWDRAAFVDAAVSCARSDQCYLVWRCALDVQPLSGFKVDSYIKPQADNQTTVFSPSKHLSLDASLTLIARSHPAWLTQQKKLHFLLSVSLVYKWPLAVSLFPVSHRLTIPVCSQQIYVLVLVQVSLPLLEW